MKSCKKKKEEKCILCVGLFAHKLCWTYGILNPYDFKALFCQAANKWLAGTIMQESMPAK